MGQPMPPQYPGMMYYPQQIEGMLTRRNVFVANALGLVAIYLGTLFRLATTDPNIRGFGNFLLITGGLIAVLGSLAGALGSKRTSDMQNIGLLVWAGLLLGVVLSALG